MTARTYKHIGLINVAIGIMIGFLAAAAMDGMSTTTVILLLSAAAMIALASGAVLIRVASHLEELEADREFLQMLINAEDLLRADEMEESA